VELVVEEDDEDEDGPEDPAPPLICSTRWMDGRDGFERGRLRFQPPLERRELSHRSLLPKVLFRSSPSSNREATQPRTLAFVSRSSTLFLATSKTLNSRPIACSSLSTSSLFRFVTH